MSELELYSQDLICLIFYDHVTTLSDEVKYIWRRKFSSVTLLFLMNRFSLLLWTLLAVYINFGFGTTYALAESGSEDHTSSIGCQVAQNLTSASQMLLIIIQAAFIAIRIYALSGGQWFISAIIFVSGMSGGLIYMHFGTGPQPIVNFVGIRFWQCKWSDNVSWASVSIILSLVGPAISALVALADLAATAITWRKMRSTISLVGQTHVNHSITSILLRDGGVLFFFNVISFATYMNNPTIIDWISSTVIVFQTPLQAMTVSHFLLNLREAAYVNIVHHLGTQQTLPILSVSSEARSSQHGIRFASFVGPMGGSLDIGSREEFEDESSDAEVESRESGELRDQDATNDA
ncbi:hypothetical protein CERSUDRAFT_104532 [Gelatoporia subvermispora B]|uniref:DUF6533 domain-containing protein n=1 Tax=Ceriporiopsis subvermispora (strain B) TaxID=914234 RepID=M2R453_CERS8|nr:hypothetical protein CERSUDRAFT_104532 [Gelatoporia subvermispora B]